MNEQLDGRVALVTGGGRGIGRATAAVLLRRLPGIGTGQIRDVNDPLPPTGESR